MLSCTDCEIRLLRACSLPKNERGMMLMTFAGCLFGLLAVLALAVDSGHAFKTRLLVQTSLDSAALAAARVIAEGNIAGYAGSVEARATAAAQNAARVNLSENAVVSDPQVLNSLVASMVVQTEEKQSGIKKWKEVSVALNRLPAGTLLFSIIPGGMKSFLVSAAAKAKVRTANVHIILDTSASTYCPPQNVDQLDECGCGEASASGAPCSEPTKLTLMKDAVEEFIKQFDSERDRIGLVSFNTAAKVDVTMAQAARGWASSGIMTKLRSLQPAGQTNICDALYHAQVDMQQNGLAANAVYVLVSDGAPTAGRFSFANARQPLPGGPDYFIWDDRVDCIMSPDEPPVLPGEGGATVPNPDYRRIKKTMVSRIHDTAKPPNAPGKFHPGTFYELAMDRSGPTESRSRNGEMADYLESSWYEYLFSSFVPCSNISCREIIELEEGGASYAVVNRLRACLKDVSFNTYQNWSNRTDDNATAFLGADSAKWEGAPVDDSDAWWTKLAEGLRYRELFYDCANAAADTIRKSGGTIYVIAIGHAAPTSANETTGIIDAYQDTSDRFRRKDIFLRRMAFDPCGAHIPYENHTGDPHFVGFDYFDVMAKAGQSTGLSLTVEPEDPEQLAESLKNFFRVIAIKVKTRLLG